MEECTYQTPGGYNLTSIRYYTKLDITATSHEWDLIQLAAYMLVGGENQHESWAEIHECSLSWCGKVYSNTRVQYGLLDGIAPIAEYNLSRTSPEIITNTTSIQLTAPDDPPGDPNFTTDRATLESLQAFLKPIFTTSVTRENASLGDAVILQYWTTTYETRNLSKTMFNVANSLTDYIRNVPDANRFHGEECPKRQYVSVNWAWLILPVLIVVLAIILVAISVAYNHQRGTLLWKSSSLPFLFHGLDGWQNENLNLSLHEQMEYSAKSMQGQLRRNADDEIRILRTVRVREPYHMDIE